MTDVLVTGGTGHLGQPLVRLLLSRGHKVRVLARKPGADPDVDWVKGDLSTGEGVSEAIAGAKAVIHAATWSPAARRGYMLPTDFVRTPAAVDVEGTRRLLDEARNGEVGHFLYVSIVGLEQMRLPYARMKLQAESLVADSGVPWSIVRATGFYWLLDRMLEKESRLPVLPLPTKVSTQPVDSDDFAEYVVRCLEDGPLGARPDFAGPQVLALDEMARSYLAARDVNRRVLHVPVPPSFTRALGALPASNAVLGTRTWEEWLRAHHAG